MLKLTQVHAGYKSAPVLKGIDLTVAAGDRIAILGRNGVGKTTLLKAIAGLVPTTAGTLYLNQTNLTRTPAYRRIRAGIGYVPQGREIFGALTVKENILTGQYRRVKSVENNLEWLLDLFPMLAAKLHQRGDSLSGGQQQQLAIARALVARPKVLLLDEPSDGIQPSIVLDITAQLKDINHRLGTTLILVEQNLSVVQHLSEQVYIMTKGAIAQQIPTAELSLDHPLIHQHLGV
ncbi:MAG: ABC transporter ATP-binding protein [Phormidesmis sp.]